MTVDEARCYIWIEKYSDDEVYEILRLLNDLANIYISSDDNEFTS